MIIGFDGSRAFASWRTGTENYSFQLLKALSGIDRKNDYIVYVYNLSPITISLSSNFRLKEISWPRLWTQGGLALQTFKDDLDVLFVPAHTLPLIKRPGLNTVVTVHDLGSEYLPQMHQFKQRLYLSFMQRYQLNSATRIIAVSKATKNDLVKRVGIDPEKIKVIYEGINTKLFKPARPAGGPDTKSNTKDYFLFVGTIQPRKNIERIIEAAVRLGEKLVVVGAKGWGRKPQVAGKVEFLGYVADKKLPALYSNAIALVFPSLFEGFGLPILEAQACGCPVITSNISSMPEVAGKGAIYVNPYSVESIKDGMVKIMDSDLRLKIKDLGFKNVRRFSWEKCARETLKVLESI